MNWNSNPFIKASPNKVENKISKEKKYIKKPYFGYTESPKVWDDW